MAPALPRDELRPYRRLRGSPRTRALRVEFSSVPGSSTGSDPRAPSEPVRPDGFGARRERPWPGSGAARSARSRCVAQPPDPDLGVSWGRLLAASQHPANESEGRSQRPESFELCSPASKVGPWTRASNGSDFTCRGCEPTGERSSLPPTLPRTCASPCYVDSRSALSYRS